MVEPVRRLFGHEPPDEQLPDASEYADEEEILRAQIEAEPSYLVAPLPSYDHDAPCPKCRFAAGTTQYQRGYHEPCAIPESPWRPFVIPSFGRPTLRTRLSWKRFAKESAAIPEHFERACPNCKYAWAEAIL